MEYRCKPFHLYPVIVSTWLGLISLSHQVMASWADSITFWSLLIFKSSVLFRKSISNLISHLFLSSGQKNLKYKERVNLPFSSLLLLRHASDLRVIEEEESIAVVILALSVGAQFLVNALNRWGPEDDFPCDHVFAFFI